MLFCISLPVTQCFYLLPRTRHRNQSRLSCLQRIWNAFCSERRLDSSVNWGLILKKASVSTAPSEKRIPKLWNIHGKRYQSRSPFWPPSPKGSLTVTLQICRREHFLDEITCHVSYPRLLLKLFTQAHLSSYSTFASTTVSNSFNKSPKVRW